MRKQALYLFSLGLLLFSASLFAQLPDFTGIVERTKDAVVNISTTKKVGASTLKKHLQIPDLPEDSPFGELFKKFLDPNGKFHMPERESNSLGSGFIISKDGYILTNHHVVDGADEVIVRMSNRKEYEAKVIGSDKAADIAVLKIEADEDLPTVKIGDSEKLKVGQWVLAIGSPFGFDHSVTAGIVSAIGRSLPSDNYVPFIQTDVAINPGNSGGPLLNLDGKVIGINSQIYSRTGGFMGLSFAIPIELAMDVAEQIKTKGSVSRGWLGVLIQEVTRDLAESFGMETPHGALVAKVMPDSPAQKAGLRVGDVIVEFNGKKVSRSSALPPLVGRFPVGKTAEVVVVRNKKRKTLKVRIEQLPEQASAEPEQEPEAEKPMEESALGLSVQPLDAAARKKLKVDSGVQVMEIDADGPAADAGIQPGDVISMIDNRPVKSLDDFNRLVKSLKPGKSVAILIHRRGSPIFLAIKPKP